MTKEKGKKITMDQLAKMMKNSFDDLENSMNARFDRVEVRLDRIESKLDINHENRISRPEDDMRIIKTKLEK